MSNKNVNVILHLDPNHTTLIDTLNNIILDDDDDFDLIIIDNNDKVSISDYRDYINNGGSIDSYDLPIIRNQNFITYYDKILWYARRVILDHSYVLEPTVLMNELYSYNDGWSLFIRDGTVDTLLELALSSIRYYVEYLVTMNILDGDIICQDIVGGGIKGIVNVGS